MSTNSIVTLYHTITTFNDIEKGSLWKHDREKEKIPVTNFRDDLARM